MTPFVERLAIHLHEQFHDEVGNVCVVLPNRRAGLFLKKYLSQLIDKPVFAPTVFSIEDFVFYMSGLRQTEPVLLLFEFFEVYQSFDNKQSQSFNEFVRWADVALADFNDADLSLTDTKQLFGFLSESKALSLWNLDEKPLTDFEIRYLEFYNSMADLYERLKKKLIDSGVAYQGLAYRELSERLQQKTISHKWKNIVFAGFNALSIAEEKIIKHFTEFHDAQLLWDTDPYYVDDPQQEAGSFLRKNKKTFGISSWQWSENNFKQDDKKITLIGVPKMAGQAKVAGDLLSKIQSVNPSLDKTSLVLNDENMLAPLLNSLPSSISEFNVTMGLPLRSTALFGLVAAMMKLQENALRFNSSKGGELKFYFKDLLRVLNHPFLAWITKRKNNIAQSPNEVINSGNHSFYSHSMVMDLLPGEDKAIKSMVEKVFEPWGDSAEKATRSLLFLLKKIKLYFADEDSGFGKIELEQIYHFSSLLSKIEQYIDRYSFVNDLDSFKHLYNTLLNSVSMPFYGEPLKGVQIMGMLETRNLDFEHVVMLSVNEDFLPGGSSRNSFIPFDIRAKFGLPTHRERHAVSAYHFYRLLQRAKNVYLLYNTEPGNLGGGDRSRFIAQLEYELQQYNPKITIDSKILSLTVDSLYPEPDIVIPKTGEVKSKLKQLAEKGLSASTINSFRNCSLQFYFRHILNLQETEEVEETIEASTLGTVVHEALHQLYVEYIDTGLSEKDIQLFKKKAAGEVKNAFAKHYPGGDIRFGKNLLLAKVAESLVLRFLDAEEKSLLKYLSFGQEVRVKALELRLEASFKPETTEMEVVHLKGFIDRFDQLGDTHRIIDYKTGKVEKTELKIKEWEELLIPGKHDKIFQLLFYALLYSLQGNTKSSLQTGIFSLRNLGPGLLLPEFPEKVSIEDALENFKIYLNELLSDLFDPALDFRQAEDQKICKYCTFKSICNR